MNAKTESKKVVRKGQIANGKTAKKEAEKPVKVPAAVAKAATAILVTLKEAALATIEVRAEMEAMKGKREGAYALYVRAGVAAKTPAVLEAASQQLFAMIRDTGAIDGQSLGCKASKDGASWQIPSSISAAKSYVLQAMTANVPLIDEEGAERSFRAIRQDVMEIAHAKRMAEASDLDKMRAAIHAQLEMTAEAADDKDANIKDLADLLSRLQATYKDYGYTEEGPQDKEEADALNELVGKASPGKGKQQGEQAAA